MYEVTRSVDNEIVLIRKISSVKEGEKILRMYAKFKGVICPCGCEFMVSVETVFPSLGAKTTSWACRKCLRKPFMKTIALMKCYSLLAKRRETGTL